MLGVGVLYTSCMVFAGLNKLDRGTPLVVGAGLLACVEIFIVARFGASLLTVQCFAFAAVLAYAALADARTRTIPNACIVAALCIRVGYLVMLALLGQPVDTEAFGTIGGMLGIGGLFLIVALASERITGRSGMGMGDVKLFAVCGCYFGFWNGLLVVFGSCVLGLIGAKTGIMGNRKDFPFAPAIALSCMLVMLLG